MTIMKTKKKNIDCGFIDLPYGEILINSAKKSNAYNDEHNLTESKFFEKVCEKTGMRSFEEFWENYFEIKGLYMDTSEFVANMMTYCYLTRTNTPQENIIVEGCHVREQFMAENILKAAETHKRVLVVTGGFHTYGLYRLTSGQDKLQKVKVHKFNEKDTTVDDIISSLTEKQRKELLKKLSK